MNKKTDANNGLFEAQNAAFSSEHIDRNISNLSESWIIVCKREKVSFS